MNSQKVPFLSPTHSSPSSSKSWGRRRTFQIPSAMFFITSYSLSVWKYSLSSVRICSPFAGRLLISSGRRTQMNALEMLGKLAFCSTSFHNIKLMFWAWFNPPFAKDKSMKTISLESWLFLSLFLPKFIIFSCTFWMKTLIKILPE